MSYKCIGNWVRDYWWNLLSASAKQTRKSQENHAIKSVKVSTGIGLMHWTEITVIWKF